jgi:leucyl aminopeptidase (aminopeptidase T)
MTDSARGRPVLLVLGLLHAAAAALAQQAPPSRVDWPRIADLVIRRSLSVRAGDRVLLFHSPELDRGALPAIRTAIGRAGGVLVGEIVPPDAATREARAGLAPATRAFVEAREDSAWTRGFDAADAAIWLPTDLAGLGGRPFERLIERFPRVRSIHFHWFLPPDPADVDLVDSLYAAASLVPPAELRAVNERLAVALRGATVWVTAPNGTNLTFRVPRNAWFHGNDGDASRAKGPAVRDREEELPAGVLRTTGLTEADGRLVGHVSFDTRSPVVAAHFQRGQVSRLESVRGAEPFVSAWDAATGDKRLPAEFVIGTNPALPAVLPSGFMPYYAYGAGTVRLAIGDNWESGGPNRAAGAANLLFFIPDATVAANGVTLVRSGRLER